MLERSDSCLLATLGWTPSNDCQRVEVEATTSPKDRVGTLPMGTVEQRASRNRACRDSTDASSAEFGQHGENSTDGNQELYR